MWLPTPHPKLLAEFLQDQDDDETSSDDGGLDAERALGALGCGPYDLEIRDDEAAGSAGEVEP